MSKQLSEPARELLHALINNDAGTPDMWYDVIQNSRQRCAALDELLHHALIETHKTLRGVRATPRGIRSNELFLETGWQPATCDDDAIFDVEIPY